MPVIPKNLLLIAASGVLSIHAYAATISGNTADAEALSYFPASAQSAGTLRSGYNNSGETYGPVTPVFVFQLPTLGTGESFSSVTLSVSLTASSNPGGSATLALLTRTSGSATVLRSDFSDFATTLQSNFVTTGMPMGTVTSTNIASWVNAQYAGGANAGSFIFLRVNTPDANLFTDNGYTFASANNGNSALWPTLTYTAVPEPSTYGLMGAGALASVAFVRRRRKRE